MQNLNIKKLNTLSMSQEEIETFDVNTLNIKEISELTGVSFDDDIELLFDMAADYTTDFHILHMLSFHIDDDIREQVACNPRTLTGTLVRLMDDTDLRC